jgi:hypothetical protein
MCLHGWRYGAEQHVVSCYACCSFLEYMKDAVRLVASRELHVCSTFARRFYWSDLNLWPEDLAPGSVVLLSGKVGAQALAGLAH